MAKIQFTARKDPLLRDRQTDRPPAAKRAAPHIEAQSGGMPSAVESATLAEPADAAPTATATSAPAHEEPRGVVAVTIDQSMRATSAETEPLSVDPVPTGRMGEGTTRPPAFVAGAGRAFSGRRFQTSISLPPSVWSELDLMADGAGTSAGELLVAVLRTGLPESPEDALKALERLLDRIPIDEGLLEERNYRLPLELREALDRFAKMLAPGPRPNRSLLVRAILTDQPIGSAEHARELVNGRRLQAMRASLQAAVREAAA